MRYQKISGGKVIEEFLEAIKMLLKGILDFNT
jgi:hypothetical protein